MNKLKDCSVGDCFRVQYVEGEEEEIRHLQNLGFVPTSIINVVNVIGWNMIVQVFDSRIAINHEVSDHVYGTIMEKKVDSSKIYSLFRRK